MATNMILTPEQTTQVIDAVRFYYNMPEGRIPKAYMQDMLSKIIGALQMVLIAIAAQDPAVKEEVRELLVEIRGMNRG